MNKLLKNKKIIFIIGGGIAAYKSLELIRLLKKQGCEIKAVLTESGKKFVTPLSIASLSQNKVYQDIFDSEKEAEMDHISLSRWCDIILFAPVTANSIAKLASGRADDLASTLILASNKQVMLAPAMNVRMWLHKSTQNNIKKLLDYGYLCLGPVSGEMACGEYGDGKMSSPEQIYKFVIKVCDHRKAFPGRCGRSCGICKQCRSRYPGVSCLADQRTVAKVECGNGPGC